MAMPNSIFRGKIGIIRWSLHVTHHLATHHEYYNSHIQFELGTASVCQVFYLVMAESMPVEEKSLDELESEITCSICQEHYTEPKVLPCLHYYCKKCILKLALRTQSGKSFNCPECRCQANLPEGGVDNFKTAFFTNRLKSKVINLQRAHGKVEVKCEYCTASSNAEAFCRQCSCFICNECVQLHSKVRSFFGHKIASLEDLKHGRAKPITVKEPPTSKCEVHEEPFIIYCYDCSCLVCQHCTIRDHRYHKFEFTKKAAPGAKTKLLEDIQSLKDLKDVLEKAGGKISPTAVTIEAQKQASINNLHTSFKELHNILELREQELVEDATAIAQVKLQKLSQQEKTLSLASAQLQSVVDYTERCVSVSTDNELVSMDTEIRKTIQQKIQEHSKSGRSLEPVEEADMAVEVTCAEALQQLCLTQANVTTAVDQAKCTVDLTAPAEVGKPYVGTLTTILSNGKPNNRKCKVTCHTKSLCNGVTNDCVIDKDGPGRYSIQYTPTVRGRHEMTVLINCHHVAGSPFPVYVFIHPTQLGKSVKIWTGIRRPLGITANSKGEILLALRDGATNIIKYNAEGKRVDLVERSGLVAPRCIACDEEDNIYCVDEKSNKILTCDGNGDRIQIHEVELEKNNSGRAAIAVTDQKLFMTERRVAGIKVYNKQLQHLATIKHSKMNIVDILFDIHQNLYASDIDNSYVHVFTKDGVHLRSIGHDKKKLKDPWGLCIHGQYVYVTDTTSHCVFVFTTDGEYVTSFGQKGQKEGDFDWPCYIYVDKNGFIYVTDLCNNRIQCF